MVYSKSGEILDKLKARDFNATILATYDFSTLYTTLPYYLIQDKLIDLIERTFNREGLITLHVTTETQFFIVVTCWERAGLLALVCDV